MLYKLRKCFLAPLHNKDTAKLRFWGKLGSKELNDVALQPNCALWKLHIAAGDSPGAFLLHPVYELYVQRWKDGMEQGSVTGLW